MQDRPEFDRSKLSLKPVHCEIWEGWIYVSLHPDPLSVAEELKELSELFSSYNMENYVDIVSEDHVWNTNWKYLTENFMEGYHLSTTHRETLHKITPTRLCKKMGSGEGWTGYHAYYDPNYPPRGPFHPDLTDDEKVNSPMYGIYPNLVVGMATNFTLFMCLRPNGVNKVNIRWGVTGLENDPNAKNVKDYIELCRAFKPDDYEGSIWDFTQYMAKHLASVPET